MTSSNDGTNASPKSENLSDEKSRKSSVSADQTSTSPPASVPEPPTQPVAATTVTPTSASEKAPQADETEVTPAAPVNTSADTADDTEPDQMDGDQTGSGQADAGQMEPNQTDAGQTEPDQANSDQVDPDEPLKVRPYPRIVAIANQKGGVGKTTSTINLGACMAELGHRTLIVDLDPQANASTGLGIDPRSLELSLYDVILRDIPLEDCIEPTAVKNLFLAPSSLDLAGAEIELVSKFSREHKLRNAIASVSADYDYVFIDCPPSLGLLTINALTAATEVCVPIQCEYYALEGLGQLIRNVELVNSSLNPTLEISHIVLVMYDGRTKLAHQVVDEVRGHFGSRVCKRVIPRSVRLSEAPSYGQPITTFDSDSKGAAAYRDVAKEIDGV